MERQEQREAEERQVETLGAIRGLLNTANDARRAAVVLAAVTALVAGVGLFATLAAVPGGTGSVGGQGPDLLLKPALVAAAIATLAVLAGIGLGAGLYEVTRHRPPERARTLIRAVGATSFAGSAIVLLRWTSLSRPAVERGGCLVMVAGAAGAGRPARGQRRLSL